MSCRKIVAKLVSRETLPTNAPLPPSDASPAMVFAALPPDTSTAGPIEAYTALLPSGRLSAASSPSGMPRASSMRVVGVGNHVHQRVADGQYVNRFSHVGALAVR
jgi:hypothetical protein